MAGASNSPKLTLAEKMLQYRALVISERTGISRTEATKMAREELKAEKKRSKVSAKRDKKLDAIKKQRKARNNKKPTYLVNGKIVTSMVSGGLPSLGKRR